MKKRAPKLKQSAWRQHLNIGYALENDPENCEQPTFTFVGATIPLLYDVFKQIASGGFVCRGFKLNTIRTSFSRGKHHVLWFLRVVLIDFNAQFMDLSQVQLLMEASIKGRGHRLSYFKINTLINL